MNFFEKFSAMWASALENVGQPSFYYKLHIAVRSVMLGSYAFLPSSGVEEVFAMLDVPVGEICNPVLKSSGMYCVS